MTFVTDFADQAVLLPLVLAVAIALLAQGWRRGAGAWLLAMFATFGVMLALKLVFLGCPPASAAFAIRTPSGHVAAATVVAGGLAALMAARWSTVLALAALTAIVIGWSRLALGLHTLPEVVLGALVGLAGVVALLRFTGLPPPNFAARRVILIAVAVVLVFHGWHLPAEAGIRATAFRAAQFLAVCQSN